MLTALDLLTLLGYSTDIDVGGPLTKEMEEMTTERELMESVEDWKEALQDCQNRLDDAHSAVENGERDVAWAKGELEKAMQALIKFRRSHSTKG